MAHEHVIHLDWSSDELRHKLKTEHNLDWWDVDEAIKWDRVGETKWVYREDYGWRLRVVAVIPHYNRTIKAYLKPIDRKGGDWVVKTAF